MTRDASGEKSVESPGASGAIDNTASEPNNSKNINTNQKLEAFVSNNNVAQHGAETNKNKLKLDDLRVTQDYAGLAPTRKILTVVPLKKPGKQQFVRVHPSDEWSLAPVAILELKDDKDRESYLVMPCLQEALAEEVSMKALFTAITRNGDVFIWPVKLPGPDGRTDTWSLSALRAVQAAKEHWVRVSSNMGAKHYEVRVAEAAIPDPQWPDDCTFEDLVNIAFKDKVIDSLDHPVVRRLRGTI